nr:50S ribosomal protein L9-like [Ipomoea batatas]
MDAKATPQMGVLTILMKLFRGSSLNTFVKMKELQVYKPKEDEEVKVVPQTKEDRMKEYQAAANRLDRTKVVTWCTSKVISEQHLDSDVLAERAVAVVLDGSRAFVIEILVSLIFQSNFELSLIIYVLVDFRVGICEGSLAVFVDGFNPTLAVAADGVCQMFAI